MAVIDPKMVPSIEESIALSAKAHEGQFDKVRQPYILHPLRVMLMMLTFAERTVAILHDVIEDTDVTLDELKGRGYPPVILAALDSVTKRKGERYEDYVKRAAINTLGRKVKKADLLDNFSPVRHFSLGQQDRDRLDHKYTKALDMLREAELKMEGL